jgi:hypothetical protein
MFHTEAQVYTVGYVVEKDKVGFTRGQAAHAAIVVDVAMPESGDGKGSVSHPSFCPVPHTRPQRSLASHACYFYQV